ncbi:class I SAM-dependent methyltransferase [Actinomycetospora aeridis]|uniref:Class I SAM-dependent methyltransferase n=1 Tax=Actinomycetospora aeridis TaxID=3129231 RepID=A0ABU8N1H9_9PSEU
MSVTPERTTLCQTCEDVEVTEFLSLGMQPAFAFPADAQEAATEPMWPLDLGVCTQCSLVQAMEPVSERILFNGDDYHHLAGLTAGYRGHLRGLADELAALHGAGERRGSVVEIGSNDGSLLDELAERRFDVLGVDPCGSESAAGSPVVRDYFSSQVGKEVLATYGPADVVVTLNAFAHVTDLHDVLKGVTAVLDDEGMFVSESHYLVPLLEGVQYDFAYHEHSRYYSVTALQAVFAMHGLEVFRVDEVDTHGGSIRVFAGYPGVHGIEDSVGELRRVEDALDLTDLAVYEEFARRVARQREDLRALLRELTADGSRVAGASAPGRAITVLNYCDLGPDDLEYIGEISPRKIGRLLPGTHIPVVDQKAVLGGPDQPEYALLLSWHIADEVIDRLRSEGFRGTFVVPLPEPRVVDDA